MDYKVVHIISSCQRRGAEMFAFELCRELTKHGVNGKILSLFHGLDRLDLSVKVDSLNFEQGANAVKIVKSLQSYLAKHTPDIVLAHGGQALKYAVLARFRKKKPLIIYRKIGLSDQWIKKHRFLRLLFYKWLFHSTDAIAAVGVSAREELIRLFNVSTEKVRVIYRGMNQERFNVYCNIREELRNNFNISKDAPVLISVGALAWEKNQEVMLRALKKLMPEFPDLTLLLVGDGDKGEYLRKYAQELGVYGSVCFLGVRSDVPELLSVADVFLLTSLTEGVPGVLIEAGLAGLPCVTWDVAGASEVVNNGITGMVTPMHDEATFNAKIIELLSHPEMADQMGKSAREFCRDKFSMSRCADDYLKLFEKSLAGKDRAKHSSA